MAFALGQVPVDRITAEAREVRFGRTVLTLVAGILFAIGWTAGKAVLMLAVVGKVLWFALAWCGAALRLGWRQARSPRGGDG